MRCTRCDGLAVPQAVGLAPDGLVVFGWCLACLAEAGCQLVEVPSSGLRKLNISVPADPSGRRATFPRKAPASRGDPAQWTVAIVASLMIGWGLVLVSAGLFGGSRPAAGTSPLGNGTAVLLGVGGTATAVLGLGLMVVSSRRNWFPGTFPLALLSWLGFLAAQGILAFGILRYDPRRNVSLVLAAGLALAVAVIARILERLAERETARRLDAFHDSWGPPRAELGDHRSDRLTVASASPDPVELTSEPGRDSQRPPQASSPGRAPQGSGEVDPGPRP